MPPAKAFHPFEWNRTKLYSKERVQALCNSMEFCAKFGLHLSKTRKTGRRLWPSI